MAAVSVIVPAYQPGPYLRPALDSLLAQTFTDWDALVVDDGSAEDLSWVADVDPRISFVRQANQGLSAARNLAIGRTGAPLVAFLDADDVWLPNKLGAEVAAMAARPTLALVSTRFQIIDDLGVVTSDGFEGYHDSYEKLLQGCGICVSTVVVRRSVLDEVGLFDLTLMSAQDWDLWLRIAHKHPLSRLDEVFAHYRVHPGGMTRNWRRSRAEARTVLQRHDHPLVATGLARADTLASHQAIDAARVALGQGRWVDAAKDLIFVVRHRPRLLVDALRP